MKIPTIKIRRMTHTERVEYILFVIERFKNKLLKAEHVRLRKAYQKSVQSVGASNRGVRMAEAVHRETVAASVAIVNAAQKEHLLTVNEQVEVQNTLDALVHKISRATIA